MEGDEINVNQFLGSLSSVGLVFKTQPNGSLWERSTKRFTPSQVGTLRPKFRSSRNKNSLNLTLDPTNDL